MVNVPLNPVEYKKEYNCIIETAEKNGFKKTLVDKTISAQKRLRNIKDISTLETITKRTPVIKNSPTTLGPTRNFKKYSKTLTLIWHPLINVISKT